MRIFIVILTIVIAIMVALSRTAFFRGFLGELRVRFIIGKTKKGIRYVINNYMIVVDGKSSQIDHILINRNGIFIIETKNYSGRIYGNDKQIEWVQVLKYGKVKNHFYNPVKQNATHAYRMSKVLTKNAPLVPIVVFVKNNIENIDSASVISASKLRRFVKFDRGISLTGKEMESYYECLIENESKMTNKDHVKEIKELKIDLVNNICPRCGGNLVERLGKYGKFFGCENYPKCKFIKK